MPRWKQQLGGLFIAALSGLFVARTWQVARTDGQFNVWSSFALPAFCVIGIGIILFPSHRDERLARGEDITGLEGAQLITPRWWAVLLLGFAAGFVNHYLLSGSIL